MRKYLFGTAILILATACGPELVFENSEMRVYVKEVSGAYDESRFDDYASDGYSLGIAEVAGDSVRLNVSYSGGCGGADFRLLIDEPSMAATTDSVASRSAVLLLEDNDNCEAIVSTDVTLPLSSLPAGPYTLFVYNPSQSGEVASVTIR